MQGPDAMKWYAVAPLFALLALAAFVFALTGCAHRNLVCTFVKIDGEAAIMCADADVVKGQDIRPYQPAPPPGPKSNIGPYWRYDGHERDQKGATK